MASNFLDDISDGQARNYQYTTLNQHQRPCNLSDPLCDILVDIQRETVSSSWQIALVIGYVSLIAVGIVSNILVCCVVIRQWTRHRRAHLSNRTRNLYILNLALADLALCCICMPITLHTLVHYQWSMGVLLCKLTPVIQAANILVSAGTVTAIAMDRYNTIITSLEVRRRSAESHSAGALTGLALIWIASLLLTCPLFFYTNIEDVTINGVLLYQQCNERWPSDSLKLAFTIGLAIVQFVIPVSILSTIHIKISAFLELHLRPLQRPKIEIHSPDGKADEDTEEKRPLQKEFLNINRKASICSDNSQRSESSRKYSDASDSKRCSTPDISPNKRHFLSNSDFSFSFSKLSRDSSRKSGKRMRRELRRNRRTTLLLSCIAAVYAISWLPYHVYNVFTNASPFFTDTPTVSLSNIAHLAHLLAMSSVCINPFLYGWLNTNFRQEFISIFGSFETCCRRASSDGNSTKFTKYDECLRKKSVLAFVGPKTKDCVVVALFSDKAQQPNV